MYVNTTWLQTRIWTGGQDQRPRWANRQLASANPVTRVTPCFHSNYRDPLRSREEACQRWSHYLSAIYRSQRWGGGESRHKDMRRSSLKFMYKAEIFPLLNPSGPSQPAIIPPTWSLRTACYHTSGSICSCCCAGSFSELVSAILVDSFRHFKSEEIS